MSLNTLRRIRSNTLQILIMLHRSNDVPMKEIDEARKEFEEADEEYIKALISEAINSKNEVKDGRNITDEVRKTKK